MERYWVPMWVVECGVEREVCISMVKYADAQRALRRAKAEGIRMVETYARACVHERAVQLDGFTGSSGMAGVIRGKQSEADRIVDWAYARVTCDKCGYLEEVELTAIACKWWDERNVKSSLKNHGWFCGDDQEVCESCRDNDEPVHP